MFNFLISYWSNQDFVIISFVLQSDRHFWCTNSLYWLLTADHLNFRSWTYGYFLNFKRLNYTMMQNLSLTFYKIPWESYISSSRNKPFCYCYKMCFLHTLKFKRLFRKNFSKPLFRMHKYFKDFSFYFYQNFQIEPKLLPNF